MHRVFCSAVLLKAVFHMALTPRTHRMWYCTSSRYVASPSPQELERQVAKSLRELSTDEVCQWFTSIGLQKCLPFIKG